jgi:hypothetical protein
MTFPSLFSIYSFPHSTFTEGPMSGVHPHTLCPCIVYSIANPANTPPTITPITPGTFSTAAPVLCAGADAEADDEADGVREAEVELELELEKEDEDELEVLDDSFVEDMVPFLDAIPERVGSTDPDDAPDVTTEAEAEAENVRDGTNVGVPTEVGAAVLRVGSTRPLGPKKGALLGSNAGPVSAA